MKTAPVSPQRTPTTADDPPCVRDEIISAAQALIARNRVKHNPLVSEYLAWLVNQPTEPEQGAGYFLVRDDPLFFSEWKAQKAEAV